MDDGLNALWIKLFLFSKSKLTSYEYAHRGDAMAFDDSFARSHADSA